MAKPLVSVIVLNYNGKDFIPGCLESLRRQSFRPYEVVVVDNASADGSAELVKRRFPWARLVRNSRNLGFATGNNIGVRAARGKYVVLLNYDTVADRNFIKELVAAIERDSSVAAAQAKILLFEKEQRLINTSGTVVHYLGFGWCGDYRARDRGQLTEKEIAAPSGAAVMFKKDIYERVGGLDDDFFLYHEDTDIAWRLRLRGYKTVLAPKAVVRHKYSFGRTATKFYFVERNRLVMLLKNYSTRTLLVLLPALLLVELAIFAYSVMDWWFVLKLRGWWWILANIPLILRKRAAVQAERKLPDSELIGLFADKIEFEEVRTPLTNTLNKFLSSYWRLIKGAIR